MKLTFEEFAGLGKARSDLPPKLRNEFDDMVSHAMGGARRQEFIQTIVFASVVGLFVIVAATTFVISVLAALKVVQIDDRYFSPLWGSFAGSFIPLGVWLVRALFARDPKGGPAIGSDDTG